MDLILSFLYFLDICKYLFEKFRKKVIPFFGFKLLFADFYFLHCNSVAPKNPYPLTFSFLAIQRSVCQIFEEQQKTNKFIELFLMLYNMQVTQPVIKLN